MSDTATAPVEFTITEVTPLQGAGALRAVANVVVAVTCEGGYQLKIGLQGCQIRVFEGRWCARGPAWKDPRTGRWRDALALPPELAAALGKELVDAWEDMQVPA